MLYQTSTLTLLGVDSSNISSHGSVNAFVGDAFAISISITSSSQSASRWTVMGSNADGMQAPLVYPTVASVGSGEWSIITTILSQGIYAITPGFRWLDVFRAPWD